MPYRKDDWNKNIPADGRIHQVDSRTGIMQHQAGWSPNNSGGSGGRTQGGAGYSAPLGGKTWDERFGAALQRKYDLKEREQDLTADVQTRGQDLSAFWRGKELDFEGKKFGATHDLARQMFGADRDDKAFDQKTKLLEGFLGSGSGGKSSGSGSGSSGGGGADWMKGLTGSNFVDVLKLMSEDKDLQNFPELNERMQNVFRAMDNAFGQNVSGMEPNQRLMFMEAAETMGLLDHVFKGNKISDWTSPAGGVSASSWDSVIGNAASGGNMGYMKGQTGHALGAPGARFFGKDGGYVSDRPEQPHGIVPVTRADGSVVYTNRYDHYGVEPPEGSAAHAERQETRQQQRQAQRSAAKAAQKHEDWKLEQKKGPVENRTQPQPPVQPYGERRANWMGDLARYIQGLWSAKPKGVAGSGFGNETWQNLIGAPDSPAQTHAARIQQTDGPSWRDVELDKTLNGESWERTMAERMKRIFERRKNKRG